MGKNTNLTLIYIKNGKETKFLVKDIDHAVRLADAIAESDLLDDSVDYNMFDVCYNYGYGDYWEDEDGRDFDEYWKSLRYKEEV